MDVHAEYDCGCSYKLDYKGLKVLGTPELCAKHVKNIFDSIKEIQDEVNRDLT